MIGWETIGSMTFILLALLAPVFVTLRALGADIRAQREERKLLTDYKEKTIEQITRLEEQVRAIVVENAANKLVRDLQYKETNEKIDREIHGQGETREKAYQALQTALKELRTELLTLTVDGRNSLERIVSIEVETKHMLKDIEEQKERPKERVTA